MALTIAQLKDLVNSNLADNSNIEPSEHRAVELALIDYLEILQPINTSNAPVNKGYITANNLTSGGVEVGLNIGTTLSDKLRYIGNISSVSVVSTADYSIFTVTLQNSHPNTDYKVRHSIENAPTSVTPMQNTSNIYNPVFKIVSNNQIQIILKESGNQTQTIRLHIETFGY
jgi:hypothetical protein